MNLRISFQSFDNIRIASSTSSNWTCMHACTHIRIAKVTPKSDLDFKDVDRQTDRQTADKRTDGQIPQCRSSRFLSQRMIRPRLQPRAVTSLVSLLLLPIPMTLLFPLTKKRVGEEPDRFLWCIRPTLGFPLKWNFWISGSNFLALSDNDAK